MLAAPFDRLPEEGAKAYQAFTVYRDLPVHERSLQMVSQRLGKNKSLCPRWCAQFQWVDRANAWDSKQDQVLFAATSTTDLAKVIYSAARAGAAAFDY